MSLLLLLHPKVTPTGGDPTDLAANLQAFWPHDEVSGDALDAHTNSLDLTDTNTVGTNATGSPGGARCRTFTRSVPEYFIRADETALQTGNIDWSLAFYFKTPSSFTGDQGLVCKNETSGSREFQGLLRSSGVLRFRTYNGGSTLVASVDSASLSTSTWYSCVVTVDATGTVLSLYVTAAASSPGSPVTDSSFAATPGTGSSSWTIGRHLSSNHFDGEMSAVAFWKNRELSSTDVVTWHNSGSELAYTDIVPPSGVTVPQGLSRIGVGFDTLGQVTIQ